MLEEGDVAHDVSFWSFFLVVSFLLMDGKMCWVRIYLYARSSLFLLDFAFRELGLDVWIQRLSKDGFDEITAQ